MIGSQPEKCRASDAAQPDHRASIRPSNYTRDSVGLAVVRDDEIAGPKRFDRNQTRARETGGRVTSTGWLATRRPRCRLTARSCIGKTAIRRRRKWISDESRRARPSAGRSCTPASPRGRRSPPVSPRGRGDCWDWLLIGAAGRRQRCARTFRPRPGIGEGPEPTAIADRRILPARTRALTRRRVRPQHITRQGTNPFSLPVHGEGRGGGPHPGEWPCFV